MQFNRNQLWPEIDLQGSYGLNGLGDNFIGLCDNYTGGNTRPGAVGVVVSLPLGNRARRAPIITWRDWMPIRRCSA